MHCVELMCDRYIDIILYCNVAVKYEWSLTRKSVSNLSSAARINADAVICMMSVAISSIQPGNSSINNFSSPDGYQASRFIPIFMS